MTNKTKQQGFTLIELIVVIVILGILAVTAAPKFMSFTTDARASTVKGLSGAVKGAAQLIYSKEAIAGLEAKSKTAATSSSGVATTFGYPAGTVAALTAAAGITSANDGTSEYYHLYTDAAADSVHYFPASLYDADATYTTTNIESGGCYVKYVEAASAGAAPTITFDASDCDSIL